MAEKGTGKKTGRKVIKQESPYSQHVRVHYVKKKNTAYRKFVKPNRVKLMIVFSVLVVLMGALIVRLNYINLTSGDSYAKQVLAQQQNTGQTIPFRRGDIVDRNGTVLATSEKVYNLVIDAYVINHSKVKEEGDCVEPTLDALEKYFGDQGIDIDEIRTFIRENSDNRYKVLVKHLSYDVVNAYQEAMAQKDEDGNLTEGLYVSLSGVWFEEEYIRKYPYGTLACDLIGYTNSGDVGAYGLEAYYDDELNGTDGREYGYITEDSVVEENTISPINGYTIVSTIDINIQQIIEKHLKEFNEAYGSKNSAVIVQDVNTGEILGMASYPYYDLNDPDDISEFVSDERWEAMTDEEKLAARQAIWRNFCVSDAYEAGSTLKTLTMAAALEENLVTKDTNFSCSGSVTFPDGNSTIEIACTHVHGTLDLEGALAQSCNAAFMSMGDMIGTTTFQKYQRMFGLGQKTNVDLPGETSGLLYTDSMSEIDLVTNAFGQNYTVNMLQVTSAFASVVNGGSFYRPHVVKEIQSESGSVIETINKELVRTTVSESTSEIVLEALEKTVLEGTGTTAAVDGYRIGGKTGTAEKYDDYGQRADDINLVSFISTAPVDDPQVVVYVLLDEPDVTSQANAAKMAATMTGKIYKELLPYLQIFPEGTTDDTGAADTTDSIDPSGTGDVTDTTDPTGADVTDSASTGDGQVSDGSVPTDGGMDSADSLSPQDGPNSPYPESEETTEPETDENGNVIETKETLLSQEALSELIAEYGMTPLKKDHVRE